MRKDRKDWITFLEAAAIAELAGVNRRCLGRYVGPSGRPIIDNGVRGAKRRVDCNTLVQWLQRRREAEHETAEPARLFTSPPRTVAEMIDRLDPIIRERYPTSGEHYNVRDALKLLRSVAGDKPAADLTAEDIHAAQQLGVELGLSRNVVNARIRRIRWALRQAAGVGRRWIPATVLHETRLVDPLKFGRTKAHETEKVAPVDWEVVAATIAVADLELATAIELQWHTGARPGEIVNMRRSELHTDDDGGLVCVPKRHKTAHFGIERRILIGPLGRSVLDPWLRRLKATEPDRDRLFRWSSTTNYRRTITRLNERHGLTTWTPNQIRHAFATRVRAEKGLEVAQVLLGHRHADTTQIYAERDNAAGTSAMRDIG